MAYSKQIHDKLGIAGYGLVAKQNAGNTPFRFMPQIWAYGGGALDEATDNPTYKTVELNTPEAKAALQASYDMYVRDKSVPVSALTNTQNENQAPFIAGQLAMMIAHPSEYAKMVDLAGKATGADKAVADEVVANMRYGLIPKGPTGRRAVVFGGSNIHIDQERVCRWRAGRDGGQGADLLLDQPGMVDQAGLDRLEPGQPERLPHRVDEGAARHHQVPRRHHLDAAQRASRSRWCPEAPEIMNIIIPDMLQNALTGKMTVDEAADDAAEKVAGPDERHVRPTRGPAGGLRRPARPERDQADVAQSTSARPRARTAGDAGLLARIVEHRWDYAYVLPALIVMMIVIAYPIWYTIELSFYRTPPNLQMKDKIWDGLHNYQIVLGSKSFRAGHRQHADLDRRLRRCSRSCSASARRWRCIASSAAAGCCGRCC